MDEGLYRFAICPANEKPKHSLLTLLLCEEERAGAFFLLAEEPLFADDLATRELSAAEPKPKTEEISQNN